MHVAGYSRRSGARPFPTFAPIVRLTQRVPTIIPARDQVGQLRKSSRESGVLRSWRVDVKRGKKEEKGKKKGDALSAPQIAVYVSGGVGYGNLLTDSRHRRGYRLTGTGSREIGRDARLT